jgi:hypothetical protein
VIGMLRLVKNEAGEDAFFLLCDHRSCMEARRGIANTANVEEYRLTKKQFMQTAIAEGWWIDIEVICCPMHAKEMILFAQEQKEKASQRVAPAGPRDLLVFGKSR